MPTPRTSALVGSSPACTVCFSDRQTFNIPLAELPEREVGSGQIVEFFGMRYVVPVVTDWPSTVVAVNIGGAVIPTLLSLYLLIRNRIWGSAGFRHPGRHLRLLSVGATRYPELASPFPLSSRQLSPQWRRCSWRAPMWRRSAYISGTLGTLIGADLLNLGKVQGLGAPVVSIGGAGTFDGIFLTGNIAVLLASFSGRA